MASAPISWPLPMKAIGAQNLLTMPGGVSQSGYLHKKGGSQFSLMKWPLRFIILHKGCVYYFKSSTSPTPQGAFSLNGYNRPGSNSLANLATCPFPMSPRVMRATEETTSSNVFPFKIVHFSKKHRTWYFSAASEEERKKWMLDLRKEIDYYHDRRESHFPSDPDPDYGSIEKPLDINYNPDNADDDSADEDDEDEDEDYLKPDGSSPPTGASVFCVMAFQKPSLITVGFIVVTNFIVCGRPTVPPPAYPPPPVPFQHKPHSKSESSQSCSKHLLSPVPPAPSRSPPPPAPHSRKPPPLLPPPKPCKPDHPSLKAMLKKQASTVPSNWGRDVKPFVASPATLPICNNLEKKLVLVAAPRSGLSLPLSTSQNLGKRLLEEQAKPAMYKPPTLPKPPPTAAKDKPRGPSLQRSSPDGQSFRSSADEAPAHLKKVKPKQDSDSDDDYENELKPVNHQYEVQPAQQHRGRHVLTSPVTVRNALMFTQVLVVWDVGLNKARNYRLFEEESRVFLEADVTFPSLAALVEYYYLHPLPNHDSLCLQKPYGYTPPR
ncbi:SH3 domain-binding protein 2-like [Scleropages formosus]|uniref:SH3 domain-binding protein 2-like n=1 Tax=Scleropages formosus TaxID=113540 RepID=A0A0N8JZA7_SCLFO|nr:SH3 domain-binding protein 2-like [Scleropages formosus]